MSLIRYFLSSYKERTGQKSMLDRDDTKAMSEFLKRRVIDKLVLRGLEVKDMTDFVDWVFENRPPEKWQPRMLGYFIQDWMILRDAKPRPSTEIDRTEEDQLLKYLGEGYFDSDLTKHQYWTGLVWRYRTLTPDEIEKIRDRQARTYGYETLNRLGEWENELRSTRDFDAARQFYLELAASRERTVAETLVDFDHPQYRALFTEDELNMVPKHL